MRTALTELMHDFRRHDSEAHIVLWDATLTGACGMLIEARVP